VAMREVGRVLWADLRAVETLLVDLAERHRDTVMVGRTHGQPGSPITFGFKAASWADEVRRHVDRLGEGRSRWLVGQLGGAVGVLGFFGDDGPAMRAAFCAELGLSDPGISWLTSRDRLAEFASVLTMICATLARIGNEVLELQRTEVGELREPTTSDSVGSITMPHKRNPERGEHLDTLSRLVRASAGVLLEGMVQIHERDGRGWKAEWVAFPEVCLLTGVALRTAIGLLSGLEVDVDAMAANVPANAGSERVLATLTARYGKHEAQARMHAAIQPGAGHPAALEETGLLEAGELPALLATPAVAGAKAMVDEVVARSRAARLVEPDQWV
jgi:adenylosuccinate lyase